MGGPRKRKGSSTVAGVPAETLAGLEEGRLETATLAEALAIRMDRLLAAAVPALAGAGFDTSAGVVARMARAGELLRAGLPADALARLAGHRSDTVRGWVAFAYGQDESRSAAERIDRMRPFAADPHFGVREWAWMAVRGAIVAETETAIGLLTRWTADPDPRVRRFASEATRPRGVWSASIPRLRADPSPGLAILAPLRHDASRYVEDSVANWLNDAGKDNPGWLRGLLAVWESDGVASRLLRRAGRSLSSVPATSG